MLTSRPKSGFNVTSIFGVDGIELQRRGIHGQIEIPQHREWPATTTVIVIGGKQAVIENIVDVGAERALPHAR